MDEREALLRWAVETGVPQLPAAVRQHLVDRCGPAPLNVRRGSKERQGRWLYKRTAVSPKAREALVETLGGGFRHLLTAEDAPALAGALLELGAQYGPTIVVTAKWLFGELGREEVFGQAEALLPDHLRETIAAKVAEIVATADRIGEALRQRANESERRRQEALAGVQRVRRQHLAALAEARRQRERAERAAAEAGRRVAEARREADQLRAEVERLKAELADRDALLSTMARDFEARLARVEGAATQGASMDPGAGPLWGARVLVVGDPGRAAAYRLCAVALGAAAVEFLDGTAESAGARLRSALAGADLAVLVAAYAKHKVEWALRAHAPAGTRLVTVRRAGMAAFREALLRAADSGPAAAVR